VVVVRGRVDHKEAGKSCVVVQEVSVFEPSDDEVERARAAAQKAAATPRSLRLRVDAALLAPTVIDDLKHIFENHPGEAEVVLEMRTTTGPRALRFGERFRVAPSVGLNADLHEVLGPAALA
jgi:DNA polymerase-3 subunit alpha